MGWFRVRRQGPELGVSGGTFGQPMRQAERISPAAVGSISAPSVAALLPIDHSANPSRPEYQRATVRQTERAGTRRGPGVGSLQAGQGHTFTTEMPSTGSTRRAGAGLRRRLAAARRSCPARLSRGATVTFASPPTRSRAGRARARPLIGGVMSNDATSWPAPIRSPTLHDRSTVPSKGG